MITFIYGWNQYLWPLLIITDVDLGTTVAGDQRDDRYRRRHHGMELSDGGDVVNAYLSGGDCFSDAACLRARPWSIVRNKMAGLKLQAVTKSWDGKTQVIKPLTLDVADGEFIVMVGPSGCGKSTLLRMVAGLERVTEGDIWINDQRVTEMEPKDRGIAMVFQNYALYPHMSVEENMAWGAENSRHGQAANCRAR